MELTEFLKAIPAWAGGLLALVGVLVAYLTLPAHLVVDGVSDKIPELSSESRIRFVNKGQLPAWNVTADLEITSLRVGSMQLSNSILSSNRQFFAKLSRDEAGEIPIMAASVIDGGAAIDELSGFITLRYRAIDIPWSRSKSWSIQLKKYGSQFQWDINPVAARPSSSRN